MHSIFGQTRWQLYYSRRFYVLSSYHRFYWKRHRDCFYRFLKNIRTWLHLFFGQGYDGAKLVSGEFHEAQSVIRQTYPLALYSHCAAHSFKSAVSSACNTTAIKNSLGVLQNIQFFYIWIRKTQYTYRKFLDLKREDNITILNFFPNLLGVVDRKIGFFRFFSSAYCMKKYLKLNRK